MWRRVLFKTPCDEKKKKVTAKTTPVQLTQLKTGLQAMKYCANAWPGTSESDWVTSSPTDRNLPIQGIQRNLIYK